MLLHKINVKDGQCVTKDGEVVRYKAFVIRENSDGGFDVSKGVFSNTVGSWTSKSIEEAKKKIDEAEKRINDSTIDGAGLIFSNFQQWEEQAKKQNLKIIKATHFSGEGFWWIAKTKEGNNRGQFDPTTKTGSLTNDGALSDLFGGLADGLLEVTEKEARDSKTKDANFLANTNDPEERKKQKEFLKNYFGSDYSPVRHDAFVIRYNKEQEEKNQKEYQKNRNIDSSPDWYDDLGLDENTKAIVDLFCSKKKIKDYEDLHELAEELGIEPSSLEEKVYALIQAFFSEGRYMSSDVGNIDSKELKMGDEVELEHTKSPIIARRIALDHLSELPDYYTRLAKMEQK